MKMLNGNIEIESNLKKKIELHFDNKWKTDRNQSTDEPEENDILDQLPESVQDKIFLEFLFFQFWDSYRLSFFKIPKNYDDAKKKGN
jgi:hypothetical protein